MSSLKMDESEQKQPRGPTTLPIPQQLMASADQAYDDGNIDLAVGIYRDILNAYPETTDIERKLGVALRDKGDKSSLSDAIQMFRLAVSKNPSGTKARIGLALTYFQSRDFQSALRYAQDVLVYESTGTIASEAYYTLGQIHAALANYGLAQDHYEAAIDQDKNNPDLRVGFAEFLIRLGQPKYAQSQLEVFLGQNPADANITAAIQRCEEAQEQLAAYPLSQLTAINDNDCLM